MECAECGKNFSTRHADYICPICRHKDGTANCIAVYDDEGYNQWGTKYNGKCKSCGADYPCNMLGMGFCPVCDTDINPMRDKGMWSD